MEILVLGKIPPIEGGASNLTYKACCDLAMAGYTIDLVSDASEVEPEMKEIGIKYKKPLQAGKITIHSIKKLENFYQYPTSNLRSERIFGLACDLIQKKKYDLIIGWYMIPYGKIAVDLGVIYKIRSLIVHGGSDLMVLSQHRNLKYTISYILRHSTAILTANNQKTISTLIKLGAEKDRLIFLNKAFGLPEYMMKKLPPVSLQKITKIAQAELQINYENDSELRNFFNLTSEYKKLYGPTIILYGKVGEGKKTLEILRILNTLNTKGRSFNFIGIFCGSRNEILQSLDYFLHKTDLLGRSIILPPIAPWLVPYILKKASIGICSEVGFGVLNHLPILPREMMRFGVVPVISEDLYKSPFYKWILQPEANVLVAFNNDFEPSITKLLTDLSLIKKLKKGAMVTSKIVEENLAADNSLVEIVDSLVKS